MRKKIYVIAGIFAIICVMIYCTIQKKTNLNRVEEKENTSEESNSKDELVIKNIGVKEEGKEEHNSEERERIRQILDIPAEESFQLYSEDRNIVADIAAAVEVPDVKKIPVVIVKKRHFPENRLETMTNIFLEKDSYEQDLAFKYKVVNQSKKQFVVTGKSQDHNAKLVIDSMKDSSNLKFEVKTKESYKLCSHKEKLENNCVYTEAEAIQLCNKLMKKLKIKEEFQVVHTDWLCNTSGQQMCGYRFSFTRLFNGVGITYDETLSRYSKQPAQYNFELITCDITDEGLVRFQWNLPMSISNTLAEDTKLLSYQQMLEVFKKQVIVQNSGYNKRENSVKFQVNRISFGLIPIKNEDMEETYTLLPVWDFYEKDSYVSIVTLNAIDGSVVERIVEY